MINLAIVEDDEQIRLVLKKYLATQDGFYCDIAVDSVESFFEVLDKSFLPDIVLMDIGLPGMSGIDGIKLISAQYPDIDIIMLTIHHEPDKIFSSIQAGAIGYLLKNTPLPDIRDSIYSIREGGSPMNPQIARQIVQYMQVKSKPRKNNKLSEKEQEIVIGLVDGLSYKSIAERMKISVETVRFHIKNIYKKLHVHSKTEVVKKSLLGEI